MINFGGGNWWQYRNECPMVEGICNGYLKIYVTVMTQNTWSIRRIAGKDEKLVEVMLNNNIEMMMVTATKKRGKYMKGIYLGC